MERRVITTEKQSEDISPENSLRPKFLSEYIGQAKIKKSLGIYIEAAKDRGEPLRSEERRVGKECRSRWSPYH